MALNGLPLESRCTTLKEQYKDYINMLYLLEQDGIQYYPNEMILKDAKTIKKDSTSDYSIR